MSLSAGTGTALLYADGTVSINDLTVSRCSVVFPGDLVQTQAGATALINASGFSVMISAGSVLKFEDDAVSLERGRVRVGTAKATTIHDDEVTVRPASNVWTNVEVYDSPDKIEIVAEKGNVNVSDSSGTTTLSPGQGATRNHSRKKGKRGGAVPASGGGVLDSEPAIISGAAAVMGLTIWVFTRDPEPISPSRPDRP